MRTLSALSLLLLVAAPARAQEEDLAALAKHVRHYPTKFRLITIGRPAVEPLMAQLGSDDEWLRFESMSTIRWIVNHSKERAALAKQLASYLVGPASVQVFVAELLGDLNQPASVADLAPLLGKEGSVALAAVDALRRIEGDESLAALMEGLKTAKPAERDAIYHALGARGDKMALPPLVDGAQQGHEAAVVALGDLGEDDAVATLREVGTPAAFAALVKIGGAYADGRCSDGTLLWQLLGGARDDAQRGMVIAAIERSAPAVIGLGGGTGHRNFRPDPRLVEALLPIGKGGGALAPAAQHAVLAMIETADPGAAPETLRGLVKDAANRSVLIRALAGCGRARDPKAVPLLVEHAKSADTNVKTTALASLRAIPGKEAEAALAAACAREADPGAQVMLIRALGDRGGETAMETISEWLEEGPEDVRRAAVDAYVKIAGRLPAAQAEAAYLRTLDTMPTATAVRGLARVGDAKAAAYLARLANGDLAAEAQHAMVAIGRRLAQAGDRDGAVSAFRQALDAGALVENELRLLGEPVTITARDGVVGAWWIIGPFDAPDVASWKNKEFPEEGVDLKAKRDGKGWRPVQTGQAEGVVNLDPLFRKNDLVTAYAFAEIVSKKAREAVLKCGSDDGIRVWVNDELVHDNPALRGVTPGEDSVRIRLKEGSNTLLVKVCEQRGDWSFCVRLEDGKGRPLKFKIR